MKQEFSDEEIELRRKLSLFLYGAVIFSAILTLIFMIMGKIKISLLALILIILVVAFMCATKLKATVLPHLSNNLIKKCVSKFSFLTYSQGDGIPENHFKDADFVKKYTGYQSFNFVFGKHKEKDLLLSDIVVKNRISTSQKNETSILFKGVFGITDFANENNIEMVIGPDIQNKFLNNVSEDMKKALGANRKIVRLENSEFERYFEVYSDDQVLARKIITMTFMEKMVEFRKSMKKNITLIYKKNKIYFFIENKMLLDTRRLYLKGITEIQVEETMKFLDLISDIVNRSSNSSVWGRPLNGRYSWYSLRV